MSEATRPSDASSGSNTTRVSPAHSTIDMRKDNDGRMIDPETNMPVEPRPDAHFFADRESVAEFGRQLSRTQSSWSTRTQDPASDEFDWLQHLKHTLRKSDEQGLVRRDLGVVFEDLTVSGTGSGLAYAPSMGEIVTAPLRLPQLIKSIRHPARKIILDKFSGYVKPGEMVLVLGRPGSGCSSLLKTLANDRAPFKSIEGHVSYDGFTPEEMHKNHAGDTVYLPEDDIHLPTLTVGQTLTFAAATRAPAAEARLQSRAETIAETRDTLMTLFGLRHTVNTKVGNDVIRGVSGGERKRVSIAELMTTNAKVACHDNSTRGLDSSTALEYTRALRIATDIQNLTTILSIYQCGENIYQLFDKVCVIYNGQQAFFGPVKDAVQYFYDMGYEPQPRQTSADFLVAVTDPKGRFVRKGFEGKVPKTAEEFAQHFRNSEHYKRLRSEIDEIKKTNSQASDRQQRFVESAKKEHAKHVSSSSSYRISYPMMIRIAMTRRWQMLLGDLSQLIVTSIANVFQALIIGSVYFQMPLDTSGFFSRGGVIFFAILFNSFTGLAEITTAFAQRPVVVRQRKYAMLRPSADQFALTIVDLPAKFITTFLFDVILYFMSGLQASADQFFVFLLFTFVVNIAMLCLFRAIASSCRAEAPATSIGGILVLIVAIYTGYAIPRPSMVVWWRWLSYAQPVSFGFEALLSNEFRTINAPCVGLVPSGPGYEGVNVNNQVCTTLGSVTGQRLVNGSRYLEASFGYTWEHAWRNLGIIFGFLFFFLAWNLVTTEYQKDESTSGAVMLFRRKTAPKELQNVIGNTSAKDVEDGKMPRGPAEIGDADKPAESTKDKAADHVPDATDIFTWRDVCFDVMIKGERRRLLNNVSGYVQPGKMTAMMGESGAGKTTLLNVLAQRAGDIGVVHGNMLVNGKPLPVSFQRQTGYVQQQDVHMATATVREALQFSAQLRQPASVSKKEKLDYVEDVIRLLEMESYAEATVGDVGFGLSVEQRKRLTIGVELAAKPALLVFLDEPTSGLDSQSAWSIVQLLRKLADHGQAILATIHQPSAELFQVFDRLILLKKGGEVVYQGELGQNSQTLIKYFEAHSDMKCGEKDNPAEYILDVIGAGASAKTTQDWAKLWRQSDEAYAVETEIDRIHREYQNKTSEADKSPDSGRGYAAHTLTQFSLVLTRVFQHYYRDPTYLMAKFALNIIGSLFIGSSFWKAPQTISGTQLYLFAVFMAVVLAAPLSQQLQPKWVGLRTLYTARERPSRMYNWPTFVYAGILAEIPWNILAGTLFWASWYWMVGFPKDSNRAGYAYLMYAIIFEIYFSTFAQWIAAMSPSAAIASILFSSFFSFVIVFNGVVQPVSQLPTFWSSWMYHLTPFTYLIEGLVSNAIGGLAIRCTQQEFQIVVPPSGQTCEAYLQPFTQASSGYAQTLPDGSCGYCTYATGDQFLQTVSMKYSHRWRDFAFLIAYIFFNVALVFIISYLFSFANWKEIFARRRHKEERAAAERARSNSLSASRSNVAPDEHSAEHNAEKPVAEKSVAEKHSTSASDA